MKGYSLLVLAVLVAALAGWLTIVTALQTNAQLGTVLSMQDPLPGPDMPGPEHLILADQKGDIALSVNVNPRTVTTRVEVSSD